MLFLLIRNVRRHVYEVTYKKQIMKNLIQVIILTFFFGYTLYATDPYILKVDEEMIRKAYELLQKRDFSGFKQLCSPQFEDISVVTGIHSNLHDAIEQYSIFLEAFPDLQFQVMGVVPANEHRYLVEVFVTGTNTVSLMGLAPTGKTFAYRDVDIIEFDDNGHFKSHSATNVNEPLRQIGLGWLENSSTFTVLQAYHALRQKRFQEVVDLCSDDVIFYVLDHNLYDKMKAFKGKNEVIQYFNEMDSLINFGEFESHDYAAAGGDFYATADVALIRRTDYKVRKIQYMHHFQIDNGKIKSLKITDDNGF